jgi:hypothetical protein
LKRWSAPTARASTRSTIAAISGTETPITSARPIRKDDASDPREQGGKLTGRLIEHAGTIKTAEAYSNQLPAGVSRIKLSDFACRQGDIRDKRRRLLADRRLFARAYRLPRRALWCLTEWDQFLSGATLADGCSLKLLPPLTTKGLEKLEQRLAKYK